MSIKGLTDNVTPRFPRLGKLRKGGERVKRVKDGREYLTYGPDLDHFRFTPENKNSAIAEVFFAKFGKEPRVIQVYLPYRAPDENFPTWAEIWDASGLVHRCDGETMSLWREGSKLVSGSKPCVGGHKNGDHKNDAVGRLNLIIPELIDAGFVGYVVMETHGKNDCPNILSVLAATYDTTPRKDLRGIMFNLRRSQENISVPGWGERADKRSRADKWLVRLEPVADWTRLALEAAKQSALQLSEPAAEPADDDVEDGEFTVPAAEDTDFSEPHMSDGGGNGNGKHDPGPTWPTETEPPAGTAVPTAPPEPTKATAVNNKKTAQVFSAQLILAIVKKYKLTGGNREALGALGKSTFVTPADPDDIVMAWYERYHVYRGNGDEPDAAAKAADDFIKASMASVAESAA